MWGAGVFQDGATTPYYLHFPKTCEVMDNFLDVGGKIIVLIRHCDKVETVWKKTSTNTHIPFIHFI